MVQRKSANQRAFGCSSSAIHPAWERFPAPRRFSALDFMNLMRFDDARFNRMSISPTLRSFCLAQANAVLVPAEVLDDHGIDAEFAGLLTAEGRLSAEQVRCLGEGFELYWNRSRDLYAVAPGSWFPPRRTNLLIVMEPRGVVPYLEPFGGTSSMLYASDLDTHPEYVACLLVHMERLALLRSVRAALVCNLSYWFDRDDASRKAFAAAAARARRPDARTFVALAGAFAWIDELLHIPLRPPLQEPTEPYLAVEGADLYVPKRLQPQVTALCDEGEAAVRSAMQAAAPTGTPVAGSTVDALADWLQQTHAHVIVVADGTTVWSPEMNDTRWIRRALVGASDEAVASIHADLRIIDTRSRQFLERVRDVEALPKRCAVLETGGGAYIDAARRAVVYEMQQPAFDARATAAPPYHRLLLGARVMHEWGHVAHTAKFLRVPEEVRAAYKEARAELGTCFANVLAAVPARLRATVDAELQTIAPSTAEVPAALARKTLGRVGDYLANLMCSRLIPAEEMQAYVRTNVRHHMDENLGLVSELARYTYEVHYLALAGMSRSYFFDTSRFRDYFIDSGIISEDDTHQLFDAAGRVLACYAIDETKLELPAAA